MPWLAAPWPCLSCSCACCRALAARPWRVFLVGFEGTVRHPASLLFARRATALGSSGGRLGWLRPGRALAALVLAATGPFSVAFCTPCHCAWVQRGAPWLAAPWLCLSCSCASAGLWLAFLLGFQAVRCRASLLLPTGISCVFRNSPSPAPAQSPVRLRVRNCDPPKRKRALHNHPAVRAHMLVALYHNAVADTKLMAAGAALIYTSALARADHFCLALWATVRVSDARCRSFR